MAFPEYFKCLCAVVPLSFLKFIALDVRLTGHTWWQLVLVNVYKWVTVPSRVMVTIKQNTGGSLDRAEHTPAPVPCIYQASPDTRGVTVQCGWSAN